jgi:U3 small nucleolar RNA-associated protein 18
MYVCAPPPPPLHYTALDFHPRGDLLLVAGQDKYMRLFKVDGEKNEKQLAVRFNDMAIQSACFRGSSSTSSSSSGSGSGSSGSGSGSGSGSVSSEVVLCGRKPFFYSYDTVHGQISKIAGPIGRGVKSLEYMVESPEGRLLAFRGASGYVHICRSYSFCIV